MMVVLVGHVASELVSGIFFIDLLWTFLPVEFIVIHNGIITNYKDLRKFLVNLCVLNYLHLMSFLPLTDTINTLHLYRRAKAMSLSQRLTPRPLPS